MKRLINFLILILGSSFFNLSFAQVWDSLGGGAGTKAFSGIVGNLCMYNNNLIVGGAFDTVGNNIPTNSIAQWNGTLWNSIQTGPLGVYSLLEYNGALIAGAGEYGYSSSTIPGHYGEIIGQWNGVFWDTIGSGIIGVNNPRMLSLCNYQGDLYAGGYFQNGFSNTSYNDILKWNGTFWDTLPGQYYIGEVDAMAVYNGKLYLGGKYVDTFHYITAWNNTTFSLPGKGVNGVVYALAVYNGKLYAGGTFDSAGGAPAKNIASWDGTTWNAVGSGVNDTVYSLTSYGSSLIAAGLFDSAGGIRCNKIARWNGTTWLPMGSGIGGKGVWALCSDSTDLYVGGEFNSAGGIHANNIAKWTSPLGINNLHNNLNSIKVYPNPSYGTFTFSLSNINEKCNIQIYNMLGQKVYEEIRQPADDNLIDLSVQPNGVYMYRAIANSGKIIGKGKLVIEK
jgi:hypothetical protein